MSGGRLQTTREALIAELLGDLDVLMERLETLNADLPAATETAVKRLEGAGRKTSDDIQIARTGIVKACEVMAERLEAERASREAAAATVAESIRRALSRSVLLAAICGGGAGALAAAAATILIFA